MGQSHIANIKVRKFLYLLLFSLALPVLAGAQCTFSTVSGTVTDPSGIPYVNGSVSLNLAPNPPGNISCGGQSVQGHIGPVQLDSTGSFAFQVPENTAITPSGTQWTFTVAESPGVAPPLGFGPVSFNSNITINTSPQSVSTTLSAAAPALARTVTGGSITLQTNGTPNSSQLLLNLVAGVNVTLSNTGGAVTVNSTGGTPAVGDGIQYVSTSGNNANSGLQWSTAKLTVNGAVAAMPAGGGTIYMGSGTFTGASTISKPIALLCNGPDNPTLLTIANSTNANVVAVTSPNVTVQGCLIDGNRTNQTTGGVGVIVSAGLAHVVVTGNTIQNTFAEGVLENGGCSYCIVKYNSFSNNNQSSANTFAVKYIEAINATDIFPSITNNSFDESGPNTSPIGLVIVPNTTGPSTEIAQAIVLANYGIVGASTSYQTNGIYFQSNNSSSTSGEITLGIVSGNYFNGEAQPSGQEGYGFYGVGTIPNLTVSNNAFLSLLSGCVVGTSSASIANEGPTFFVITGNSCDFTGPVQITGNVGSESVITGNSFIESQPTGSVDTSILLQGNGGGFLTGVTVSGNTFGVPTGSATGWKQIVLDHAKNTTITGNTITGIGATGTVSGITLTTSSNNLIAENNISGYNGSGNGAIGVNVTDAGSVANRIGLNYFASVTTPYSDSGTSDVVLIAPASSGTLCVPAACSPVMDHSAVIKSTGHSVMDSVTLSGGAATITFTGAAVWTATADYLCSFYDVTTPTNAVTPTYTSASVLTLAGTGTDVIKIICQGF
jgi:hypothetical protein